MPERQRHGFDFQSQYIKGNNLIPDNNYTGEFDAYTQGGTPVQIKTYKKGMEMEMGDLKRNLHKSQDFLLVSACYTERHQAGKIFEEPRCQYIRHDEYKNCIGIPENLEDEMYSLLGEISNDRKDDARWKEECRNLKSQAGGIIHPRFKRDHKSQKRIQAAIPKRSLEKFFDLFPGVDIADY